MRAFARKLGDSGAIGIAAVAADRTMRPVQSLEMLAGLVRVGEYGMHMVVFQ